MKIADPIHTMAYSFAAVRGIQAGRTYYTISCPLTLVPRILTGDDEELSPELRRQRALNPSRVPGIARYLLENPETYILPPLIASIDAAVNFAPFEGSRDLGILTVPMTATFLVNDGQHRRAAIEKALKDEKNLSHKERKGRYTDLSIETIPVVLYIDAGLQRSQQMFADLNFTAAKPAKGLGVLYDHRDGMSELARELATNCRTFRGLVEMEKASIGKTSRKLFTLGAIHEATRALLGLGHKASPTEEQSEFAASWWGDVGSCIPEWDSTRLPGGPTAAELRETRVHAHAVVLHALGLVGATLAKRGDWTEVNLSPLEEVDWDRTAPHWEGRCVIGGVMQKSSANVMATADYLLGVLAVRS